MQKTRSDYSFFTARSIDVFVTKLRKYLSGDPNIEIKNIHGSGFFFGGEIKSPITTFPKGEGE